MSAEESKSSELSYEALIRCELDGKLVALARYDSILWKIRAGYILALYGTLTILGGTESGLFAATSTDRRGVLMVAFLLIGGFSACGFWLDYLFMREKFRVVDATNALYKLALDSTIGKTDVTAQYDSISKLLRISGETYEQDEKVVKGEDFRRTWHSVMWLYLISPLLGIAVIVVFSYWVGEAVNYDFPGEAAIVRSLI